METPKTGYQVQSYSVPVKRYCQTLDLRDSPELIAEYRKRHSQAEAWPEILAGIREVGILEMEIYILGTRLFMIVETPVDFDWDTAMARLNTLPRQQEWEEYMAIFQQAAPGMSSAEKWKPMESPSCQKMASIILSLLFSSLLVLRYGDLQTISPTQW